MRTDRNFFWRFLYKLHRYVGLLCAVIFIVLSITGIALNHTDLLKLDSRMIQNNWLLDHYNITSPDITACNLGAHWVSQLESQLFFNLSPLNIATDTLTGCLSLPDYVLISQQQSLILLTVDGEIIEQISFKNITRLGKTPDNHIIIETASDKQISTDELVSWQTTEANPDVWSTLSMPSDELKQELQRQFRQRILPVERVMLDLHSGRFFGQIGIIMVDIAGVCLILLSISGCMIWIKHKLRTWSHQRKIKR